MPPAPAPAPTRRAPAAGGVLIALGATVGVIVGLVLGEVTPCFLIGTAAGVVLAVAVWWHNR